MPDVLVIGAGVVGLSAAIAAQARMPSSAGTNPAAPAGFAAAKSLVPAALIVHRIYLRIGPRPRAWPVPPRHHL